MPPTRVMIVDDHTLMRSGLKLMLANQPDIEVVGEAADGETALVLFEAARPDLVLLDVSMPGLGGLGCLKKIKEIAPETKVILLTMHEDVRYLKEGFEAGASGYVLKKAADDVLYQAIRTVSAGEVFMQANMAQALVCELKKKTVAQPEKVKALSEQERRVLVLIARGYSNAEIAGEMAVSIRTVETYKTRIMEKLNTKKRSDLIKYALDQGLVFQER